MRNKFLLIPISLVAALAIQVRAEESKQSSTTAAPAATVTAAEPFGFADFSWAPGNYGPSETPMATKYFTPELRMDTVYHYEGSNPQDNTISGSSEVFRHNEFQTTQIGVGGDFKVDNVGFRIMTQFGMYSTTTPRNDSSPSRGQWNLDNAYRYISEAYASYHLNRMNGINIQSGIFMSYVGLWSYYNFDNWTYQPSYVSSNTPWFFNGVRVQFYTSDKLKIEPWLVNGWQSYGKFNDAPGVGLQILWKPNGSWTVLGNQYAGTDTGVSANSQTNPDRKRFHTDDSVMVKYFEGAGTLSKAAASFTFDGGCEDGGGVACGRQYFLGFMAYNRLWFAKDTFGLTLGGGYITNPGRYLVLVPPINGATAASGVSDPNYFSANPGDDFRAWDAQVTFDYMPTRNLTFRSEYNHRWASIPYFAGHNGMTPPGGLTPGTTPGTVTAPWAPDLRQTEDRITLAMMVRL